MFDSVAGVRVPDSQLAREATGLLRDHATPLLFAHSLRVYLFGTLRGLHRDWSFDPELLYLGAVFHDLGLTPKYRSPDRRFEIDGAEAAREFLQSRGAADTLAETVWDAIALHTTPEVPWHKRPEIALVTAGVEADVLGQGLHEFTTADRDAVLAAFPRTGFRRGIVKAFADGFAYKPATAFGTMNTDVLQATLAGYRRPDFCELIASNPLGG